MNTKLNYKKTVYVGFAFFLIMMFWQAYDNIIPKILTDKFGLSQTVSGIIMALDNVLALFMLPLFGSISDRCKSKMGRRTPFILVGTIVAALLFVGLSMADHMQLTKLNNVSEYDTRQTLEFLYDYDYDMKTSKDGEYQFVTPDGDKVILRDVISREEFTAIKGDDPLYTKYVIPARQEYAAEATMKSPATLIFFIVLLFGALIAMAIFRSPAVALMPDVTVKPLRSKGNAVINLMGACGGILVLVLGIVFGTGKAENDLMSYVPFFTTVSVLMLVALAIFMWKVKEPKLVAEKEAEDRRLGITDDDGEAESAVKATKKGLSKGEKISLLLILASVILWYMGYNAVSSKYSVYAGNELKLDYNLTLIVAQAAAIVSYLPVGIISSKVGRKKAILAGIIMLFGAFAAAIFMTSQSPAIVINLLFALAGIGWATINVNSFPMVVELSSSDTVGKYTGYYYTASMAAQTLTPVLSGMFMDSLGLRTLFPYAAIFVALSFVTMLFVKHGDSKEV